MMKDRMKYSRSLIVTGETVVTGFFSLDEKVWQSFEIAIPLEEGLVNSDTIADWLRAIHTLPYMLYLEEISIFEFKKWLLITNNN